MATLYTVGGWVWLLPLLWCRDGMCRDGMIELRVDMIVVACCLISYLLTRYPFNAIRVSSYSLKEGALVSLSQ